MENVLVGKRLLEFGNNFLIFFTLIVILCQSVSASGEQINLNSPSSVNYGEEFSVEVELIGFSENLYDVKIDIWNSTTRISEIDNNGDWRATDRYVVGSINTSVENSNSFDLNITYPFITKCKS